MHQSSFLAELSRFTYRELCKPALARVWVNQSVKQETKFPKQVAGFKIAKIHAKILKAYRLPARDYPMCGLFWEY